MAKLHFNIYINAPKEKVWDTLWSDEGYRKWTAVFMEGSYAESDWREGSSIKFLAPDGSGMFGIIKKKTDNERMTFEHHGELKNGQKIEKEWAGAIEDYILKDKNGATELVVEMDMNDEFAGYFTDTSPKGLQIIKEISEA